MPIPINKCKHANSSDLNQNIIQIVIFIRFLMHLCLKIRKVQRHIRQGLKTTMQLFYSINVRLLVGWMIHISDNLSNSYTKQHYI